MENESSSTPDLNANPGTVNATPEPTATKPRPITKLDDLQRMCEQKFSVELTLLGNEPVVVEGRQLTTAESTKLSEMLEGVVPPPKRNDKGVGDWFDFNDPGYIKRKALMRSTVRALGLYWAYPIFSEAKPNMTDPAAIHEFVQSKLTDAILEVLHKCLESGGIRKVDLVNFSFGSSPKS